MEKRQLDFNAPILSARRYSSPQRSTELVVRKATEKSIPLRQQSLPVNNTSGWENEEVTKPAAVPFHWEQIPGRPKGDLDSQAPTPDANTPRLPPARVSDAIRRNSGENPRLPSGRVSGPSRYNSGDRCNDQNIYRSQAESFACSDHAMLLEKLNESLKCKDDSDGSESGDDAYSDALDTLSVTESRSFNYSTVSGLTGNNSSGVKPSGTFCIDKQTRELMMNRFLPAAKAAVIEAPQYVAKKSQVVNEPPKPVRKVVSGEMSQMTKPTPKEYHSNVLPHNSQSVDYTESEDEQEYKAPVKKSGKVWGILPRFCVKNSLCLLNPLPVLKSKTRPASPPTPPTPSPGVVRRPSRKALSGPLDKSAYHVPDKKRFHSGLLSRDLFTVEGKLDYDSNQFLNGRDSVKLSVSPLRRYRSGNISPYRNESPKSPFREGVGFLGMPKDSDNQIACKIASSRKMLKALQDVSRSQVQVNEKRTSSVNSDDPVEKTLYVDFVNKVEPPISRPSVDRMRGSPGNRRVQDYNAAARSIRERKISEGQNHQSPPKGGTTYKALPWGDGDMEDLKPDRSFSQESTTLECISDAKLGAKEGRKSHLPPPLPKSPSESWLWRTLPSINPFSHSNQRSHPQSKKLMQKGSVADTKWETIVKTSNPLHDHIRYSEMQFHTQSKS